MVCPTSKASDQPVHTRSLIRAFASRLSILWLLSYWLNTIWSSKLKRRLQRLVIVYTCQNAKLLEITCIGSNGLQEHYQMVCIQIMMMFCQSWSGSILFERLSADDKRIESHGCKYPSRLQQLKDFLSNDVTSGSDITLCNKINKPLVVYRFSNVT